MREFTQELRSRGLKLALLSNAGLSLRAVLQAWELVPLFDCVVISAEVGMRKPDPAIYRHASDCLEIPPEACLFVDDREGNVNAALELGMHAVRFESVARCGRPSTVCWVCVQADNIAELTGGCRRSIRRGA
jgi:putative hydrolase of the HAD superfamily